MSNRFEIEIVDSSESSQSAPDPEKQESTRRREAERAADKSRREEERILRRRAREEQKQITARMRAENHASLLRIRERKQATWDAEHAATAQRKADREANREIKQREAAEARISKEKLRRAKEERQVQRDFLNDFLGAIGRSRLGYRINRGIDFVRSLMGVRANSQSDSPPEEQLLGRGLRATTNLFRSQSSSATDNSSSVVNNGIKGAFDSVVGKFKTMFDGVFGKKAEQSPVAEVVKKSFGIVSGSSHKNVLKDQFSKSSSFDTHNLKKVIQTERELRIAKQMLSARSVASSMATTSSVTTPIAAAAAGGGGSATAGAVGGGAGGGAGGLIAAGSASPVGPIIIGLALLTAAAIGVAAVFWRANRAATKMAESLEGIPGALQLSKIQNRIDKFMLNLDRSDRFGSQLAGIEQNKGRQERAWMQIVDNLSDPLLDVSEQLQDMKTRLLEVLIPIADLISKGVIKPLSDIASAVLTIVDFLFSHNIDPKKLFKMLDTIGKFGNPLVGIMKYGQQIAENTRKDAKTGFKALSKEIADFLNLPLPGNLSSNAVLDMGISEL